MARSDKRAKVARRFVTAAIVCAVGAGAIACSLFADLDGLQDGNVDAASDASIDAGETDAAAFDAADVVTPPDAGPSIDAALTPIDFVQVNTFYGDDAGASAITLQPVKPGNAIVVAIWIAGTTATPVVTDDKDDAFTAVVGPYGSDHGVSDYIFTSIDVSGNAQTVTTTLSQHESLEVYALEYSGIGSFDVGISNLINGSGTLHSGFVQTKMPNELIFAFSEDGSVTGGTGFAVRSNFEADVVEDLIAGAPGPYEATVSTTSSGEILLAAFIGK